MKQSDSIRRLTVLAIMTALSVAFVYIIHFPIFPSAPFLEYDPADIPVLIVTFAYGPLAGLMATIAASVVQGVTVSAHSGLYGIIMHIISTGSFIVTAGIIYHIKHSRTGAAISLLCGMLVSAAVMAGANLIITPLFMGVDVSIVKGMLFTAIIPFNIIKAGINGIITFLLYKHISNLIKGAGGKNGSNNDYNNTQQ